MPQFHIILPFFLTLKSSLPSRIFHFHYCLKVRSGHSYNSGTVLVILSMRLGTCSSIRVLSIRIGALLFPCPLDNGNFLEDGVHACLKSVSLDTFAHWSSPGSQRQASQSRQNRWTGKTLLLPHSSSLLPKEESSNNRVSDIIRNKKSSHHLHP